MGKGWDWGESWFNPYRSEYIAGKKAKQDAIDDANARAKIAATPAVAGTSQYVLKNPGQKANEAAGRSSNDYGKEPTLDDYLAAMGGNSGGGSGFDSAAYVANLVNQINQNYDQRQQQLGANRMSSMAQLSNLGDQYRQNMGGINQSYLQGITAQNQEIARRAQEQQAMAQRTAQQLAGSMTGEGISAQPIQGQAQNIANTLATTNQFQQDLQDRMSQLAATSNANNLASGELVRQGAGGTLENNYNAMLNDLQNARGQEILQAQQSAAQAAAGSGGSATDPLDQVSKYLKTQQLWNEVMGGGGGIDLQSLMGAAAKKQPYDFLAGIASNPDLLKLLG
jgi:hypothetical protein